MKIVLLSDINSAHTQKWAQGIASHGINVGVISLSHPNTSWWKNDPSLQILFHTNIHHSNYFFSKLQYLFYLSKIKKIIQQFQPDILHAHYATSYGLLGALTHFHPYILSVWGSDVFEFPHQHFINQFILKHNLNAADIITSTSHIMSIETQKYTSKKIEVIPFGADTKLFQASKQKNIFTHNEIIIGTVKTLSSKYGIDTLIRAFKIVTDKNPSLNLKLLLVGDGPQKEALLNLSKQLDISDKVIFYGKVENVEVPKILAEIDIFVALSREESFGVAVVEAMACEKPVIASNVSGFREVIKQNEVGFIVEKENYPAVADAIQYLIAHPEKRIEMGEEGRKHVIKYYDFQNNLTQMINLYKQIILK